MKRFTRIKATGIILIVSLLMMRVPKAQPPLLAQTGSSQSGIAQAGSNTIHLPIIASPPGPPNFRIIAPADGSQVSGTSSFAVQVLEDKSVNSVSFQAGSTELGTDRTAGDGFQFFLDASAFSAGTLQLTATATGPSGETSKSINVTVVPAPPSSTTVGTGGAILSTASGHTIAVPPGSVSGQTTISVQEKTQEQVTADEGIDWDSLGVTFLGAIDVQSSAPLAKPLGVTSVGFGNRIQPGQAVVTYRIMPDADGDGIGELVVVNGADVAPNGTVVSSPVPEIIVKTLRANGLQAAALAQGELRGPPGTTITIEGAGFNPLSMNGNVGIWTSLVDNQVLELPGFVLTDPDDPSGQIFSTLIPPLAAGSATLMLVNRGTGSVVGPFPVTIDAPGALDRPGTEIFDLYLADTIEYMSNLPTPTPEEAASVESTIEGLTEVRAALQEAVDAGLTAEEEQIMEKVASVIANSSFYQIGLSADSGYNNDALAADVLGVLGGIAAILGALAAVPAATTLFAAFVVLFTLYAGLAAVGFFVCRILTGGHCFDEPPAPPEACTPTSIAAGPGGGTTGMGSAPPPGGDGCGNAGGSPPNSVQSASMALFEPGRFIVKIFPQAGGRALTPFTGASDPGGYFYIPLIPEGEPFRALATDQVTGASATVDGVGPATGESTFMYFDFSGAQQNRFEIAIGDTVTNGVPISGAGNIEIAHGLDIYEFTAVAGQRIFVDALELNLNVQWKLLDPDGLSIFSTCLACGDPGAFTLTKAGKYTIRVGDDSSEEVGTYQFKLWDVPPAHEFDIAIGDTITNGVPGAGAGNIETPGVLDIYNFNAAAGQRVFFDVLELGVNIEWKVTGPDGANIFTACLACGDVGAFTLAQAGTYTVTVGDNNSDATGIYQFKLWNVPASQQFAINVGNTVANGSPAAGAGNIETPGVLDIYTFNASAGQRVFFDTLNLVVNIQWELLDPGGESIFRTCLACGDPGAFTLPDAGTYTIQVGDNNDDNTGTYEFKLWDVPASQEFAIAIGDTVSNGDPGPGAGNIESPGVLDLYTFTALAGEQVVFDVLNAGVNIQWQLLDPGGESIFRTCLACGDPGEFTLAEAGTYTIEVGDNNEDNTGTYSVQIRTP